MRPGNNPGFERKLGAGFAQCFVGNRFFRAIHFKNNPSRENIKAISLRISFSFSHAHFGGLGGIRTIWKNTNPVFAGFG